jgi:ABC-2 type transport system permease protein
MRVLFLFLQKELKAIGSDRRIWPVYLVFPVLAIGLPTFLATLSPVLIRQGMATRDPGMMSMAQVVRILPDFAAMSAEEGMTRYLLRSVAVLFLLMPVALSSTSAAFSIVGEKQQRTLEPILATPISDRQFLLGKLIAAGVPTIVMTWATALVTIVVVDIVTHGRYTTVLLPDRFWTLGLLVLSPLLGAAVVLVTMRFSAKATDPQATVQATALAIIPGFLILVGLFGKVLTTLFTALWIACLVMAVIDLALFRANVHTFRREEILTRWK